MGGDTRVELLPYSCRDRTSLELNFNDAEENLRLDGGGDQGIVSSRFSFLSELQIRLDMKAFFKLRLVQRQTTPRRGSILILWKSTCYMR